MPPKIGNKKVPTTGSEGLSACPFCKGTDLETNEDAALKFVCCRTCLAEGPAKPTREEACAAWNIRS